MDDTLLTLPEVRERLKVSYNTMNRYIKAGRLPIVFISRTKRYIKEKDLEDFIKRNTGTYRNE